MIDNDKRAVYQAMSDEEKVAYLQDRLAAVTTALDSLCNRTHDLAGTLALRCAKESVDPHEVLSIAAKLEQGQLEARQRAKPPEIP